MNSEIDSSLNPTDFEEYDKIKDIETIFDKFCSTQEAHLKSLSDRRCRCVVPVLKEQQTQHTLEEEFIIKLCKELPELLPEGYDFNKYLDELGLY